MGELATTEHMAKCTFCNTPVKISCGLKDEGESNEIVVECPKCGEFLGRINASPGARIEEMFIVTYSD